MCACECNKACEIDEYLDIKKMFMQKTSANISM